MRTKQGTIRYSAPFYIVCEGASDAAFIDELLRHHGFADADFHVGEAEGYDGFERHLNGVAGSTDRKNLLRLAVVADNDNEPAVRFANVQNALQNAGFPVPDAPLTIVPGLPSVGVFMMPNPNTQGNLETMLVEAAFTAHPGLEACLDAFTECVNAPGDWIINNRSKMRLNASIAAYCVADPGCSLAYIWNKQGNPIPIGSDGFNNLAEFLMRVAQS